MPTPIRNSWKGARPMRTKPAITQHYWGQCRRVEPVCPTEKPRLRQQQEDAEQAECLREWVEKRKQERRITYLPTWDTPNAARERAKLRKAKKVMGVAGWTALIIIGLIALVAIYVQ